MTLIAPFCPLREWFPDLLRLLVDYPMLLPQKVSVLRQPHFRRHHQGLSALTMTGFRLSKLVRAKDFSKEASEAIAKCRRKSSSLIYQAKWCHNCNISSSETTLM